LAIGDSKWAEFLRYMVLIYQHPTGLIEFYSLQSLYCEPQS